MLEIADRQRLDSRFLEQTQLLFFWSPFSVHHQQNKSCEIAQDLLTFQSIFLQKTMLHIHPLNGQSQNIFQFVLHSKLKALRRPSVPY